MSQALFDKIESEQLRAEPLKFKVGDIVKVHTKVREGGKERVQVFQGDFHFLPPLLHTQHCCGWSWH